MGDRRDEQWMIQERRMKRMNRTRASTRRERINTTTLGRVFCSELSPKSRKKGGLREEGGDSLKSFPFRVCGGGWAATCSGSRAQAREAGEGGIGPDTGATCGEKTCKKVWWERDWWAKYAASNGSFFLRLFLAILPLWPVVVVVAHHAFSSHLLPTNLLKPLPPFGAFQTVAARAVAVPPVYYFCRRLIFFPLPVPLSPLLPIFPFSSVSVGW